MRNRRVLMQMAGQLATRGERQSLRMVRRAERIAADHERIKALVDQIQAREKGEDGAPPMPMPLDAARRMT